MDQKQRHVVLATASVFYRQDSLYLFSMLSNYCKHQLPIMLAEGTSEEVAAGKYISPLVVPLVVASLYASGDTDHVEFPRKA